MAKETSSPEFDKWFLQLPLETQIQYDQKAHLTPGRCVGPSQLAKTTQISLHWLLLPAWLPVEVVECPTIRVIALCVLNSPKSSFRMGTDAAPSGRGM